MSTLARGRICSHQRALGALVEQAGSRLGDHHGVDDHRCALGQLVERLGDRGDDLGVGEHPDLDGVERDVFEHGANLREDHLRRDRLDRPHRERVLGRYRRDRADPVNAAAGEGLEVGLDPRPAAGVRAGDRQRGGGPHVRLRAGKIE